jgi:DNA-binding NarL/FixJ family response regulator
MGDERRDRYRVVVADDVADVRLLLTTTLELEGRFEVVAEAQDGVEAVTQVRLFEPDAVVLDLVMPRMDGLSALPEIRAASPGCRVVVLTALDQPEMAEAALVRGAHAWLGKSMAFYELAPVLLSLLERPGVPAPAVPLRSSSARR